MDVHKDKIVVAGMPEEGNHAVVREEFPGGDLTRLLKRLKDLSRTYRMDTCYEAGPSGYGLARVLLKMEIPCRVVAPTLIPRRPGNRIKTDSFDARELALALRAGTLEFVRMPTLEEEEVRGLVRCREDIARQMRSFKSTISHWLHSRGHRAPLAMKRWAPPFWKWIRALALSPMDRLVLDHYLDLLFVLDDRRKQVEGQICELAEKEPYGARSNGLPPCADSRLGGDAADLRGEGVYPIYVGSFVYEVRGADPFGALLGRPSAPGEDDQGGQLPYPLCSGGGRAKSSCVSSSQQDAGAAIAMR